MEIGQGGRGGEIIPRYCYEELFPFSPQAPVRRRTPVRRGVLRPRGLATPLTDDQDETNHQLLLQPRGLQVLGSICHQEMSFDTVAFRLPQAPAGRVLCPPVLHAGRGRCACVHARSRVCGLAVAAQARCVRAQTHPCAARRHPSRRLCCPHPERAWTRSPSQPRGLAVEKQFLGHAPTMNQLSVVVLRGSGVAAWLGALLLFFP